MLYYFFRQVEKVPEVDEQLIRCTTETPPAHYVSGNEVYCRLEGGYWGRDHGNDEGIPPDTQSRTAFGVYPAGGLYDAANFNVINSVAMGGEGAGITPIFLASGVNFMIAEMHWLKDEFADAKLHMLEGIQQSFAKVRAFKDLDPTAIEVEAPSIDLDVAYIQEVGELFDIASKDDKLNIMSKELMVVLFGNGLEAYNFYRRTGQPNDIQPNLEPNPGSFIRSFPYPTAAALRNPNFPQNKQVNTAVFWDTNPESLTF